MNEQETLIIDTFISRDYRDRLKFLLNHPKKRIVGLQWLNGPLDLDPRYKYPIRPKSDAELVELLRKEGCPDQVYLMSSTRHLDGKILPLDDAVKQIGCYGYGTIMSCIPGKLAYWYAEEGAEKAILKKP